MYTGILRKISRQGYLLMAAMALIAACPAGAAAAKRAGRLDSKKPLSIPIMKTTDIKPGMKGYGLTTFRGTKPERFDVEIVDVLRKALPKHDLILIRCSHPVIDKAHVIGGMSGSPIYIEDKLIGALAYSWGFTKEPIAGVTPIEWMMEEMEEPKQSQPAGAGGSSRPADATPARLQDPVPAHAPEPRGLTQMRVPVYLSGMAGLPPRTTARLRAEFEKRGLMLMEGAGGSEAARNVGIESLVPGAPVGLALMRGDISLTSIGTLTHREGDRIIALGHPMLFSGHEVALPITTAYIHGILPSRRWSFKFGSPSKSVGTLTQDRFPGVAGTLRRTCPMIAVRGEVHNPTNGRTEIIEVEMINSRGWSPLLLGLASTYLMFLEGAANTDFAVDYVLDMEFEKQGRLHLEGMDIAWGGYWIFEPQMALRRLLDNPFEPMQPKQISLKLKTIHKRIDARIQRAWLEQLEVQPGKEVTLHMRVQPYNSTPKEITFPIRIPAHLDEGKYDIVVAGGGNWAVRQPTPPAECVRDIFTQLKMRYPPTTAVAVLKLPSVGVGFKGQLFRQLPSSVFGTLVSSSSAGVSTFQDGIRFTHETGWYLTGETQRLKIIVKQSAKEEK